MVQTIVYYTPMEFLKNDYTVHIDNDCRRKTEDSELLFGLYCIPNSQLDSNTAIGTIYKLAQKKALSHAGAFI